MIRGPTRYQLDPGDALRLCISLSTGQFERSTVEVGSNQIVKVICYGYVSNYMLLLDHAENRNTSLSRAVIGHHHHQHHHQHHQLARFCPGQDVTFTSHDNRYFKAAP